ncbi:hypothetical protein [Vibrio sp. M260118]|uniref:hypothetical protein n=1 Tax=Vibrio sp. M260118 TaxID=3020896 RepID=UPI002F41C9E0
MNKLFTECFYFSKSNFGPIFKLFGLYVIISSLLNPFVEYLSLNSNLNWGTLTYQVMLGLIYTYLMIKFIQFMASTVTGDSVQSRFSWNQWWRLLLVYIFYGLAVMVGFIALILPGIYLAAKYAFADFEVVLNDKPVLSALHESWNDTKGITGRLMSVTTVIAVFQFAIGFIIGAVGELSSVMYFITDIVGGIVSSSVMVFTSVVYFRLYTESRVIENDSVENNL